ncbi:hypothetical protein N9E76_00545 [bacterium]|nr:hypothetical protein [bacterium]
MNDLNQITQIKKMDDSAWAIEMERQKLNSSFLGADCSQAALERYFVAGLMYLINRDANTMVPVGEEEEVGKEVKDALVKLLGDVARLKMDLVSKDAAAEFAPSDAVFSQAGNPYCVL